MFIFVMWYFKVLSMLLNIPLREDGWYSLLSFFLTVNKKFASTTYNSEVGTRWIYLFWLIVRILKPDPSHGQFLRCVSILLAIWNSYRHFHSVKKRLKCWILDWGLVCWSLNFWVSFHVLKIMCITVWCQCYSYIFCCGCIHFCNY